MDHSGTRIYKSWAPQGLESTHSFSTYDRRLHFPKLELKHQSLARTEQIRAELSRQREASPQRFLIAVLVHSNAVSKIELFALNKVFFFAALQIGDSCLHQISANCHWLTSISSVETPCHSYGTRLQRAAGDSKPSDSADQLFKPQPRTLLILFWVHKQHENDSTLFKGLFEWHNTIIVWTQRMYIKSSFSLRKPQSSKIGIDGEPPRWAEEVGTTISTLCMSEMFLRFCHKFLTLVCTCSLGKCILKFSLWTGPHAIPTYL